MKAPIFAPLKTRVVAFAAAILTSAVVFGATVLGMQPAEPGVAATAVALERVVVTAPAVH